MKSGLFFSAALVSLVAASPAADAPAWPTTTTTTTTTTTSTKSSTTDPATWGEWTSSTPKSTTTDPVKSTTTTQAAWGEWTTTSTTTKAITSSTKPACTPVTSTTSSLICPTGKGPACYLTTITETITPTTCGSITTSTSGTWGDWDAWTTSTTTSATKTCTPYVISSLVCSGSTPSPTLSCEAKFAACKAAKDANQAACAAQRYACDCYNVGSGKTETDSCTPSSTLAPSTTAVGCYLKTYTTTPATCTTTSSSGSSTSTTWGDWVAWSTSGGSAFTAPVVSATISSVPVAPWGNGNSTITAPVAKYTGAANKEIVGLGAAGIAALAFML